MDKETIANGCSCWAVRFDPWPSGAASSPRGGEFGSTPPVDGLSRSGKGIKLRPGDRLFWVVLSHLWQGWREMDAENRNLIRCMLRDNSLWGAPRILSELSLLGYKIRERTVAKYMIRKKKRPSQTWKTFLKNHAHDVVAIDFFTVPAARVQACRHRTE
jgi:hypothetical protein